MTTRRQGHAAGDHVEAGVILFVDDEHDAAMIDPRRQLLELELAAAAIASQTAEVHDDDIRTVHQRHDGGPPGLVLAAELADAEAPVAVGLRVECGEDAPRALRPR